MDRTPRCRTAKASLTPPPAPPDDVPLEPPAGVGHRPSTLLPFVRTTRSAALEREVRITSHLPLVSQIARRLTQRLPAPARHLYDDLRSVGFIGLVQAADAFDPDRGSTFVAFAQHRILGAMLDELRAQDICSRRDRQLNRAGWEQEERLRQELGRQPSRAEIADRVGVSLERFDQVAYIQDRTVDLDSPTIALTAADDTEAAYLRSEVAARIHAALRDLPLRQARILVLLYWNDCSQEEVACRFGMSPSWVSQEKVDALRRLRAACEDADG